MSKSTVRTAEPAQPQTAAGEQPKEPTKASPPPVEKTAEPASVQPATTTLLPDNAITPPSESATSGDAAARLRARFTFPARPGTMRFECLHPIDDFNGDECGMTFCDGWGTTDLPARAHHALQNGVAVFDHQSDRLAFDSDRPDNAARVAARAEQRRAAAQGRGT